MSDGDTVAQLAVVILLLGLAVPGLAAAYDYAGTPIDYEQSASISFTSPTAVDESATVEGYGDEVVVLADGGGVLEAGVDYRWDDDAGEIEWFNTSATSAGQDVTIEYQAHQRTPETEMAWTIISPFFALFGIFGLVAAVRTLWSYIAEVFEA